MEELVAELGSAFLCADLDLTPEVREDHAAYIANWLKVLKNDKRAIFSAAAHAQKRRIISAGCRSRRANRRRLEASGKSAPAARTKRPRRRCRFTRNVFVEDESVLFSARIRPGHDHAPWLSGFRCTTSRQRVFAEEPHRIVLPFRRTRGSGFAGGSAWSAADCRVTVLPLPIASDFAEPPFLRSPLPSRSSCFLTGDDPPARRVIDERALEERRHSPRPERPLQSACPGRLLGRRYTRRLV